jgi:rhodanese-related sulfurtransferase
MGEARVMRRALAAIALIGGLLAAVPAPRPKVDVQRLATAIERQEDHVTAIELARWLRDRKAGLRIVDLRTPAEFANYHLPRAENRSIELLTTMRFSDAETVVLISDGGAHAAQGWVLLEALGHRNVYFLRGGLQEWLDDVIRAKSAEGKELSRYFGGERRGGC